MSGDRLEASECPLCGAAFACGSASELCWCGDASPFAAAFGFSNSASGCVCPDCLAAPLALSWSGGKDCVLALEALRRRRVEPQALFTVVNERYDRVSIHGVERTLLGAQAASVGVPLVEIGIPDSCSFELYQHRWEQALEAPPLARCRKIAFGDLHLESVRAAREEQLRRLRRAAVFPLWGGDTQTIARTFVDDAYKALVVCVDLQKLPASFAGRQFDRGFVDELPRSVDPCGERGEFHTLVVDGPIFTSPLEHTVGGVVERGRFAYCDVVPAVLASDAVAGRW